MRYFAPPNRQSFLIFCYLFSIFIATFLASAASSQEDLADVIERCEKSVVRIEVKGPEGEGLGSGFVVANTGILVTNVHVLAGAEKATAIFPTGKRYEIVGTFHIDEGRDICIAKMNAAGLQPILLASSLPRKGERVTALGSPLGLSFTATMGIVSAIRSGAELGRDIGDDTMKGTWVQVDAAISPGNSGGPLINAKGQVVAMSTRASTGRAQNLNFGISIEDIKEAITKARVARLTPFAGGVGRIKDFGSRGGGSGPSGPGGRIVKRKEIPAKALQDYIQLGRDEYKELSRNVRRASTESEKIWRDMKKGSPFIPGQMNRDADVLRVSGRTEDRYYFRSESIKKKVLARQEIRMRDLKKLRTTLSDKSRDEALLALLQKAGPRLDPQDQKSIGFMTGAVVLHSFNDHDVAVLYDDLPFLVWVESTAGLALGQVISPTPVYVVGTETVAIPGRSTASVTVLQSVTDEELEKAVFSGERFLTWTDKTGKYSIEAILVENDGTSVHLKKRDGSIIKVPLDKLDAASLEAAEK